MGVMKTCVVKFIRSGVGVAGTDVEYADSTSSTTAPTTGWQTNAPVWRNGHFIWTRTKTIFSDNTYVYSQPVCLPSGKGIASIEEQYYKSTSATSLVGGSWQAAPPTWEENKYIWTRSKINYTDGTTAYTDPVNATGPRGATGNGISSITEYYLATSASSGVTTSTSGWTTSIQTVTATKKYLWNYEKVTYTNGNSETTTPVIIGTYGDKGIGISSITEYYLASASSSGVTTSTSGWTTSIQSTTETKRYLWNYEVITYTDGSTTTTTPVIIGTQGATGKGISSVTGYYLATSASSGVTTSTSGWTTSIQTVTETKCYLWHYEKFTYTDNTTSNSTPIIIGTYAKPGGQGNRGPALRGPQAWSDCTESGTVNYQFYAGKEGEPYLDIVLYNGNYYICTASHANKNTLPTNTSYWALSDKVAMVAANVLFANHGFFGDAIISGSWLISANGKIGDTTYTKGQTFQSELAYNLFNANSPLGVDITKHSSTSTSTLSSSATTFNRATVYLEAGRVYYLTCTGYTGNANNPCYVRLVKTDGTASITPVNLNSTSSVTRSGYARITVSGNYYIQLYHTSTGATGTVTSSTLVEKCFAPFYALNLLNGKTYQSNAYVRGQIVATSGNITGTLTVGTYGDSLNCIQIIPSTTSPAIVGYQGTTEVFRLSSRLYTNNSYVAALKMGDSFLRNDGLWIYQNGANGRLMSSQLTVEEYVDNKHYPVWLQVMGKKIKFGANGKSMWPTSKSEVSWGEVYVDGTTLKVNMDG